MAKFLLVFTVLLSSVLASANSKYLDQNMIAATYKCSNGGSLQLLNTRYGNVKKAVFSRAGSLNQIGYVNFWNMHFDRYKGDVSAYMTFPDPKSGEMPYHTRSVATMEIKFDEQGNMVLNLTAVRMDQATLNFSCINY